MGPAWVCGAGSRECGCGQRAAAVWPERNRPWGTDHHRWWRRPGQVCDPSWHRSTDLLFGCMLTRLSLVIDSSCQVIWILMMLHMKTFFPWRKRWSKEKRGKPIRDRSCSRKWTLASRLSHVHTQSVGCVNICLEQWFSTFFSTRSHYGQSASLTGRTHVIYVLRHQYKPTRFIILFIA